MYWLIRTLLSVIGGDEQPNRFKRCVGSLLLRLVPGALTCSEFEDFIYDYHEGSVSDDVRKRFDSHMDLCPVCRVHFSAYVRTVALEQQVCGEDDGLPEDLPESLVGAILLARDQESNA